MQIQKAANENQWDAFLKAQRFAPFLQSWTMGEVYKEIRQEPVRIEVRDDDRIVGICQAITVPARRGRHLMVQYGPLFDERFKEDRVRAMSLMIDALTDAARDHGCSFVRISPFWTEHDPMVAELHAKKAVPSPLHLLSEYTWYIPLRSVDRWQDPAFDAPSNARTEEDIKTHMRKTTRNLIGRAEREGVTVTASTDPVKDLDIYFKLQEETYKRHGFVPYRESFIRAQVKHFAPMHQAIVYIARYQNEPVAASVHMSFGGITSYHHGASTHKHAKIPASYLLQWTAIREALLRDDHVYNFWGIAPPSGLGTKDLGHEEENTSPGPRSQVPGPDPRHPFAGVTTFKTGFGGKPLPLMHCVDIPLSASYKVTRAFERIRKWKRGF